MDQDRRLAIIVSPQPWVGFQVSKHHYARALAASGWRVVFVDPPVSEGRPGMVSLQATDVPHIQSLRYRPLLPHKLKFHARWLFDSMMRVLASVIGRRLGRAELLWDFDNAYQFRDLRAFGAGTTLFHLVDDVGARGLGDKQADHVFTLHPLFCEHAGAECKPDHVVSHGLSDLHLAEARRAPRCRVPDAPVRLGFVGNLAADWIDWDAVLQAAKRHPEARFTFWGPLPTPSRRCKALVQVCEAKNSEFCGLSTPETILNDGVDVDVWLLPFRAEAFEGNRPLNSHKVLEYLATGKAVAMSWLEAYANNPLVDSADGPEVHDLPDRLDRLLAQIEHANSPERQHARKAFALEHGYGGHVAKILSLVGLSCPEA